MIKKVFISAPISGFEDKKEYEEFREFVLSLIVSLRFAGFEVCSELEQISDSGDYDSPTKSVEDDLANIKSSELFLMIHPKRMQTSSLMELGFACAVSKTIIIVGNKSNLPYLAKGLESSIVKTRILDVTQISKDIIPIIIKYVNVANNKAWH